MIKCLLSRLLGEKRLKIVDVVRDTGLSRGTVTRLYHETATRVDLEGINSLCRYLGCEVGELFKYIDDEGTEKNKSVKKNQSS